MSDETQTESGADVNALRNGFEVGQSKVLVVENARHPDMNSDQWQVTAKPDGDNDYDGDTVTALGGFEPKEGEPALFTRTETDFTIEAPKTEEGNDVEAAA